MEARQTPTSNPTVASCETAATGSRGGLEGVSVADTELALIDGEGGRLLIRGVDVEDLAAAVPYEGVCALLWSGNRSPEEAARLQREIGAARVEAHQRLPSLGNALEQASGMDALRAALGHLGEGRGEGAPSALAPSGGEGESPVRRAERTRIRVTAATAVFAAAWARLRAGRVPLAPRADLPHAADYLRLLGLDSGSGLASLGRPSATPVGAAAALDAYLTTAAEHGMCASTFTARVVASTDSDDVSAIVAAIGALKGPLHGGAPGPVLDMLDAIGEPESARAWLEAELADGRRIMGMGHRVYRVRDPRAAVLERAIAALEATAGAAEASEMARKLALARSIETDATALLRARHPDRPMAANVEFFTAIALDAIGIGRELFTPTFAVARVAGWLAHTDEQRRTGRIIRPTSRYVGPLPSAA